VFIAIAAIGTEAPPASGVSKYACVTFNTSIPDPPLVNIVILNFKLPQLLTELTSIEPDVG
jgi:hypothetical protein